MNQVVDVTSVAIFAPWESGGNRAALRNGSGDGYIFRALISAQEVPEHPTSGGVALGPVGACF